MLNPNPNERPSIEQVIDHPLFKKYYFDLDRKFSTDELNLLKENYMKNVRSNKYEKPEFIENENKIE